MIGRLTRIPVRKVWAHEAHDFTTWLEENIEILNDQLEPPIDVETVRREQAAGDFSVDLVADDTSGATVVIENQLERSDHDHLGKLLTYLASFDAERAVWIVSDPRPEHVRAVSWLNDSSPAEFYLFKLEAIQIGDSDPAPLLTRIVGPTVSSKQIAQAKKEKGARHEARRAFFTQLLEYSGTVTKLHSGRSATDGPYLDTTSPAAGIRYTYGLAKSKVNVGIWIDAGADTEDWCQEAFSILLDHREEIDAAFGEPLEWRSKEGVRSRRVFHTLSDGGWGDPDHWDKIIPTMVAAMIRIEDALSPFLPAVPPPSSN